MEGDITDPKGTLSGGYVSNNTSTLQRWDVYQKVKQKFSVVSKKLSELSMTLSSKQNESEKVQRLEADLKFKTHQRDQLDKKLKSVGDEHKEEKLQGLDNRIENFMS